MATATLIHTDEEIQKDVLAELKWDAQVQPNEIGVSVKDGVVTLTGWVDSYLKKWAAEDAAHRVAGVKAVANDIEVKLFSERTDADIAEAAIRALQWDASVPADKIQVTVSKGWVTLKGEVNWNFEKQDAERVVRRLTGVTGSEQSHYGEAEHNGVRTEKEDRGCAGAQRQGRCQQDHR